MVETLTNTLANSLIYGQDFNFESAWSETEDRGYVLTFYITRSGGDEPDDDIDPDVYDRISEKIAEAFGDEIFESGEYYYDYNG